MKKLLILLVSLLALTLLVACSGECEHNWQLSGGESGSCEMPGHNLLICDNCREEKIEELPALGHNFITEEGRDPTCTDYGYTERVYCDRCGLEQTSANILDSLNHDMVTLDGKPATCTEDGYTKKVYCSRCDYVLEDSTVIAHEGHNVIDLHGYDATCWQEGLTSGRGCTKCDYVEVAQEPIPTIAHTVVNIPGTPATCTEDGLTDASYCEVCWESFSDQEPIEALGHTIVRESAVEPTCQSNGSTAKVYCSTCSTVFIMSKTAPKVDHLFENGACKWCELTASVGLEFSELDDGYALVSASGCTDTRIVVPAKYNGKSVVAVAEGAFENCASLEYVELPATVVYVGDGAFNGCTSLKTVKCCDYDQMKNWSADYLGDSTATVTADYKSGMTPYELYLYAASLMSKDVPNFKMTQSTEQTLSYAGQLVQTSRSSSELHFTRNAYYMHQYQNDGAGNVIDLSTWYLNGMMYIKQPNMQYPNNAFKRPVGKELFNATYNSINALSNMIDESLFDDVIFNRSESGAFTLTIVIDPVSMRDLVLELLGDIANNYEVDINSCVYHYEFDDEGYLTLMTTDVDFDMTVYSSGYQLVYNSVMTSSTAYEEIGADFVISTPDGSFYDATDSSCRHYSVETVPGYAATCTEYGRSDGSYCKNCLLDVTNSYSISPLNHDTEFGICSRCNLFIGATDGLEYYFNDDGKSCTVIGMGVAKDKDVIIPPTIAGLPVTAIGANAFKNSAITSIVIPDSIISVDPTAFAGCTSLTKVSCPVSAVSALPESVTEVILTSGESIDADDFTKLVNLAYVTLPETLTSIADGAFASNKRILVVYNLSSLEITAGSGDFGGVAENALLVTEYIYERPYTVIGDFVFGMQYDGYSYTLALLRYYGNDKDVVIPYVKFDSEYNYRYFEIAPGVFSGIGIESITIPFDDSEIDDFRIDSLAEYPTIKSLTAPYTFLFAYDSSYVNESITHIYVTDMAFYYDTMDSSFESYKALKELVFAKDIDVYSVGAGVFANMTTLETVVLPDSVERIYESAFSGCTSLKNFHWPESLVSIDSKAFMNCTSLESVEPSENIGWIESNAFSGCTSLKRVVISGTLERFYLSECYSLTEIVLRNSAEEWYARFEDCGSEAGIAITVGKEVISVPCIFGNFTAQRVTSLTFEEGSACETIESSAFAGTRITEIVLPESLKRIDNYSFQETAIGSLVIPESVEYVGDLAFYRCENLSDVSIGKNVTYIGRLAFGNCSISNLYYNCVSLSDTTPRSDWRDDRFGEPASPFAVRLIDGDEVSVDMTVTFGPDVLNVPDYLFYIPQYIDPRNDYVDLNVVSVTFEAEEMFNIGESAFENLFKLEKAILPYRTSYIMWSAFENCTSLKEIVLPANFNIEDGRVIFYDFAEDTTVYFRGNAEEWTIALEKLTSSGHTVLSSVYIYSETTPETDGSFWHFDENGNPVKY